MLCFSRPQNLYERVMYMFNFPNFEEFLTFLRIQFTSIRVTDIVDILLLSVLLYYAYRFVSERRAGKLAMGIFIVLLVLAISAIVNFHAVKFLLGNIFQVGILALIILFQPELRGALEKVGEEPLRGFKGLGDQRSLASKTEMVESLCEAVSDMSRTKTGALIVMERSTKLGDIIRSGVELDAKVSAYLIRNIFYNKAPLHDGAMIIRNGRVCAASCFLPLTERAINQDLGTRHRAALGMSEVSDALIIIVSEETGTISIAFDGELKRNQNYQTLKQTLTDLCIRK